MNTEISAKYNSKEVENKWYSYWTEQKYFNSTPDSRESYTVIMPPPNVTGVLHMGHMLNNTIQDVLIRNARMNGRNACWVPGTDHASIATEAKVVGRLKEKGISKFEIGREKFLEHAWDWTNEHGGIILEQLKKLGASCDWNRTAFTLDKTPSDSVSKVFVELYNKGLIYRGYRMINWDSEAKTNISDEEVIYIDKQGKLYHINYKVAGTDTVLTVATTRPETIFGDTAICIHPEDERYKHLHGKKAIVPICNREIPIVLDSYVDLKFGTGCLKVTPAHDVNDYEIGKRHDLEIIDIFNDDATLNTFGLHYEGKDRFVVRKEIEKELDKTGDLAKVETYNNKVGISERTKAVIEPKLSVQWFLKMEMIAKKALEVVEEGQIKFHPQHYINTYRHWLSNIRDWNISRQLWWGHRIPAYYFGEATDDFVIAETKEKALELAIQKSGNKDLKLNDLKQDEDALDTWFSSWLWPMSVFNGILEPENEEFNYYYPTADLVTGPDIIFFWVARMIMAGNEFKNQVPFKNVYFTGIVRDPKGQKMSKSLGNSPDPLALIDTYGADGVRVGLLLSSAAGNDLLFDEDLCAQGRNFSNKIWNAFRLIKGWKPSEKKQPENAIIGIRWFENRMNQVFEAMENDYKQFRISDVLMKLYKLVWGDFCSTYLEVVKPNFGEAMDTLTHEKSIYFLEILLKKLHPYMPFLTEEIWQLIQPRTVEEALIISQNKAVQSFDTEYIKGFEHAMEVVTALRTLRKEKQISFKETLELYSATNTSKTYNTVIEKLTNVDVFHEDVKPESSFAFRVGTFEYFVPLAGSIDIKAEKEKLEEEKKYLEGFLKSVDKKLSNERFVSNAPEQVIVNERKKKSDAQEKLRIINESLSSL